MSDFDEALERCRKVGASRVGDADLLAAFCEYDLQQIVGAVSPKLVWEGAQRKGLSARDLAGLASSDPLAVGDLQWA